MRINHKRDGSSPWDFRIPNQTTTKDRNTTVIITDVPEYYEVMTWSIALGRPENRQLQTRPKRRNTSLHPC